MTTQVSFIFLKVQHIRIKEREKYIFHSFASPQSKFAKEIGACHKYVRHKFILTFTCTGVVLLNFNRLGRNLLTLNIHLYQFNPALYQV